MAGEIAPTSDHAELDGIAIDAIDTATLARLRAVLPQHTVTSFGFDALAIVLMGRHEPAGASAEAAAADGALAVMDELGVAHLAHRDIRTPSGDEQKRVHLARTLWQVRAAPGNHLLLDEPTSSLDIAHQHRRAEARRGTAVLVVLHDLNLAARFADSIAVAKAGRIVAHGTAGDVLEPEAIAAWFGGRALVAPHPASEGPMVVFCGRS